MKRASLFAIFGVLAVFPPGNDMSESIRTYQTRPDLAQKQSGFLDAYASQYGLVVRRESYACHI
ncbi:MAG: hypothetical protein ABSA46_13530 [Thermodesulfovibrionales bacterium]